ncbi:MAG: hypothetical protein MJ237_00085 [bacterium]|nr:hypothetical protein [bacterium]
MLKVVIIGYGEMFTNLIAATMDAECKIVGILRRETIEGKPFKKFMNDIFNPSVEYNYIKSYKLPEINGVSSVNSEKFRKKLLKLNPDIILVGSWGEKIEKATYDIPKIATINAHPSLLPKYRGPNPYFWTINNMEKESGVTLHIVDEGYDTGAILAQEIVKINDDDTGESLKKRTVLAARGLTRELLNSLKEDMIIPLQQNNEKSSYYSYPNQLELNFNNSAEQNYAKMRAIYPWGNVYFMHNNTLLVPSCKSTIIEENTTEYTKSGTITECDADNKMISILCGDDKVLKMQDVILYNYFDKPFTKNYINLELKKGEII